jgi:hypothetical protein
MDFPLRVAAVAFIFGVFVAPAAGLAWSSTSRRHDEVLPSHYSSLLQFDRTQYPGHCPECGTDNEPGYRFCERCGSAIPTTDGAPTDPDIGWILQG